MKKYDIFVLMAEDICPNLGCYGDLNANTPNLDKFAFENIRFNYCSSAAPVCSAARTSLNLGMYGSTAGVGQHRSCQKLPDDVKNIGEYMKDEGYFTVIGKTDFNFLHENNKGYDLAVSFDASDSFNFANSFKDVLNAENDKPIFMMQTTASTHQSQYGYTESKFEHRKSMPRLLEDEYINREDVVIPKYHFDTLESREIWSQYHEKMTTMDKMFNEAISEIKKAGKYEDSVIIFVGDNGHGIPQGKCQAWDEGVRVPFLIHLPKELEETLPTNKDEFGKYSDRLVSFVDITKTILSLAGGTAKPHMQGKVFLGDNKTPDPTEVYSFSERVDEVCENNRAIREKDYLYICDFAYNTHKKPNTYQIKTSPWFISSMTQKSIEENTSNGDRRSFFRGDLRINEQLYDINNDCFQLNNLADSNILKTKTMREKMFSYMKKFNDGAFMAEPLYFEYMNMTKKTVYEIFRDEECYPINLLIQIWDNHLNKKRNIKFHENFCVQMMLLKIAFANKDFKQIETFKNSKSETVRAYVFYMLNEKENLINIIRKTENFILLMFISDLLCYSKTDIAVECLKIMLDRYYVNDEFSYINERFKAALDSALNMLGVIFSYDIPSEISQNVWDCQMIDYTNMVLEKR